MIVLEEETMFKKLSVIFILSLAVMLLLVSCQRAASQAPVTSLATPTGTIATAVVVLPTGMGQVQMIGTTQMIQTMTAMAQTSIPGISLPTTTLVGSGGTPNTFTLVAPIGVATTPAPGITPIAIVATATPGRPSTYTLMPGEFPYCIARRFNVNPDDLMALNGLVEGETLQPGQQLLIPPTGTFPGIRALHPHPAQYSVVVDDTIYGIACHFGDVDPTSIAAANGLSLSSPLITGQVLNIP
jgi:LysM repeat protein